jgi:hypothetical protein
MEGIDMLWSEASLRLKLNGFEDGLNHTIDRLTYEILREYREGVDMAHQLMEPPMWETLNPAATRLDDHRYESDGVT